MARVDVSARVADIIPEFGTREDVITVEQLLTHDKLPRPAQHRDGHQARSSVVRKWKLNWDVDAVRYHPAPHWVLGEIIERLSN
jgi:hypothetical protein